MTHWQCYASAIIIRLNYHMVGNIGVELNLVVGKINRVSPDFVSSTFNTSIKNSKCLHLISKYIFRIAQLLAIMCPSKNFKS